MLGARQQRQAVQSFKRRGTLSSASAHLKDRGEEATVLPRCSVAASHVACCWAKGLHLSHLASYDAGQENAAIDYLKDSLVLKGV